MHAPFLRPKPRPKQAPAFHKACVVKDGEAVTLLAAILEIVVCTCLYCKVRL